MEFIVAGLLAMILFGFGGMVLVWAYYDLLPLCRRFWRWLFSPPRSKWSSLDYPTFLRRVKDAQKQIERDRRDVYK